jgi:hypothetical protein
MDIYACDDVHIDDRGVRLALWHCLQLYLLFLYLALEANMIISLQVHTANSRCRYSICRLILRVPCTKSHALSRFRF